ncbi:unnamed protein product [Brassica oleracea]|uniref:(rape) hypothetical protein n=1 Tax=Brassica napus TaxID=3708 RepID=A0A816QTN6_BRANA|nr:unnamed protein product [Brassica napus]
MEKEEMASNKIQMQVQKIKEKARVKEENRVKSMMMFQSGSMPDGARERDDEDEDEDEDESTTAPHQLALSIRSFSFLTPRVV